MKKEKKFKPKRGQVNFTNVRWTPVVNAVLKYKNKILVVERSPSMRLYPGYWNGVAGFLDDKKSLEEKVFEELQEEVGMNEKQILSIQLGTIFNQEEPRYQKTWIVHPVLVKVATDDVKLDWEAVNYKWIKPAEAKQLHLLPGFYQVLQSLKLVR